MARDEDRRDRCIGLDLAKQREAIDVTEANVEDHEIDDVLAQRAQCCRCIVSGDDVQAFGRERELHGRADVLLVVDDQHAGLGSGLAHAGKRGSVMRNMGRLLRSS